MRSGGGARKASLPSGFGGRRLDSSPRAFDMASPLRESLVRPILVVFALCVLVSAGAAQAGVRMHMPHKRHHPHGQGQDATDAAPVSDIPEPVWTPKPRG